jgi:hypothetical protein
MYKFPNRKVDLLKHQLEAYSFTMDKRPLRVQSCYALTAFNHETTDKKALGKLNQAIAKAHRRGDITTIVP